MRQAPQIRFQIPEKIDALLRGDQHLQSGVLAAFDAFQPWLADNKLFFFSDYTDHGVPHVNAVMQTIEDLVTDESWSILTPHDAAAFAFTSLLHDCAMHISLDGFKSLISGNYPVLESAYLGATYSWPELWEQYLQRATRFDESKLMDIFGDATPVRRPNLNALDISERDKRLIGDFLRLNHGQLGHEIALSGIPGVDGQRVKIPILERSFLDLMGFLSRSHSLDLRKAADLIPKDNRRSVLNVHAPFVMCALRIADYIQIDRTRAPQALLRLRSMVSPVSQIEWEKHAAVSPLTQEHDDPHALYADLQPRTIEAYSGLKSLLSGIQFELDASWAILGEVYGRFNSLSSLGLKVRRIRSNLDNVDTYRRISKPVFVPKELRFTTSNTDLLRLLVEPLYGARPEIGIRELLQNAVDACIERRDYERGSKALGTHQIDKTERPDIELCLDVKDEKRAKLLIRDHGIGMSLEILEEYFLKIGASFRQSETWKNQHTDPDGKARIARIGRFGIGILAGYLLGEEICVTTRHVSDTTGRGISFSVKLSDRLIEMHEVDADVGTTIEIDISDASVIKHLTVTDSSTYYSTRRSGLKTWDWYCLAWPKVVRKYANKELKQEIVIEPTSVNPEIWNRINAAGFDDILWTYKRLSESYQREVICNGIKVTNGTDDIEPLRLGTGIYLHNAVVPNLCIRDVTGSFPLTLTRDHVAEGVLPFGKELARAVASEYVRALLDVSRNHSKPTSQAFQTFREFSSENLISQHLHGQSTTPLIWTGATWAPPDLEIFRGYGISEIIIDGANFDREFGVPFSKWYLEHYDKYALWPQDKIESTKSSRAEWINLVFQEDWNEKLKWPIVGWRLILSKKHLDDLKSTKYVRKRLWNSLTTEVDHGDWLVFTKGDAPTAVENEATLISDLRKQDAFGFVVVKLSPWTDDNNPPLDSNIAIEWSSLSKYSKTDNNELSEEFVEDSDD